MLCLRPGGELGHEGGQIDGAPARGVLRGRHVLGKAQDGGQRLPPLPDAALAGWWLFLSLIHI